MPSLSEVVRTGVTHAAGKASGDATLLYCYRKYHCAHFIEDEWHVLFVCPLYERFRTALPVKVRDVLVEGHEMQGAGCTQRNLVALVRAVMQPSRFSGVVDCLIQALRLRTRYRTGQ